MITHPQYKLYLLAMACPITRNSSRQYASSYKFKLGFRGAKIRKMGGYFSTLGFSEQHKQICYDSLSTQNSFTPDETSIDKIQAEHKEERSLNQLSHENREKLNEFKLEIARKHEKRRQILAEKRKEMDALRQEVLMLREENEKLKNERGECKPENDGNNEIQRLRRENEELKMTIEENNKRLETIGCLTQRNNEMRMQIAEMQKELQELNTEALNFEQEREDYKTHVVALKDVIHVSKHMLQIREAQLKEVSHNLLTVAIITLCLTFYVFSLKKKWKA